MLVSKSKGKRYVCKESATLIWPTHITVLRKKCFHYILQEKLCGEAQIDLASVWSSFKSKSKRAWHLHMSCSFHFMGEFGRTRVARDIVRILHFPKAGCLVSVFIGKIWNVKAINDLADSDKAPNMTPYNTFCQQKCRYCCLSDQKCPTHKCQTKEFGSFTTTTTSYMWLNPRLFTDHQTHSYRLLHTLTYIALLAFPYLPLCQSVALVWLDTF